MTAKWSRRSASRSDGRRSQGSSTDTRRMATRRPHRSSDPSQAAPNVLLVLIDDTGSGTRRVSACRSTPTAPASRKVACATVPVHVTLCSPDGRAAATRRNNHSQLRLHRRIGRSFPQLLSDPARVPRHCPASSRRTILQHRALRQIALHPDGRQPSQAFPIDQPDDQGSDLYSSSAAVPQSDPCLANRRSSAPLRSITTRTGSSCSMPSQHSIEWLIIQHAVTSKPFFITSPPAAPTHRTTSRRSADRVQGNSTRGGTASARRRSHVKRSGRPPGGRRADAPRPGLPHVARPLREAQGLLRQTDGSLRRILGERRPQRRSRHRRHRGAWPARQHAHPLDLGDNGASMEGTVTGRSTSSRCKRHPARRRDAAPALRALRRSRRVGRRSWTLTIPLRGRGRATRRSSGASRWDRTSAVPATRWSRTGRLASRTWAPCAPSSRTSSTLVPPSSSSPVFPSPRRSTASARSRCTEPRSRRRSPTVPPRASHPAVLRDHRQPGDVQGRLVAGDEDRTHPVGAHARCPRAVRARGLGPGRRVRPSCTTCPTTSRRRRTSPPSTRRRSGSSKTCSGRRPSGTG